MHDHFCLLVPLKSAPDRLRLVICGQGFGPRVSCLDGRRPAQGRGFIVSAAVEPFQDGAPDIAPGSLRRVAAGDEAAEAGSGHHHIATGHLEENRRGLRGQPVHRAVKPRHPRRDHVRLDGSERHIMQSVDRNDAQLLEAAAEEARVDHHSLNVRAGGLAHFQTGQCAGIFDQKPHALGGGLREHVLADDSRFLRISPSQDQHARTCRCGLDCLGGLVEASAFRPAGGHRAIEVIVSPADEGQSFSAMSDLGAQQKPCPHKQCNPGHHNGPLSPTRFRLGAVDRQYHTP